MTDIDGGKIEPVDVITFGSPCQDLSVAGKRAGMKHSANGDDETTRSGLFLEAVRIIKEMRRATNGEYPKFAVWENVPGAFSSNNGEDFRTVLEELIKIAEPEAPPVPSPGKTGWPYADCLMGDGWSLAYRVFDAQYWGVPQRRRRIYLVLDLTGESAGKVLFERQGLRGHFEESGTQGQGAAGNAQSSSGKHDPESRIGRSASESGIAATLYASYGTKWNGNAGAYSGENFILEPQPIAVATQKGGAEIIENGICPTVTAAAGMSGNNQPYLTYGVTTKGNGDAFIAEERHTTLSSGGGQAGQGYPCVVQPTVIIDNIGGQTEYGKKSTVNGTLRAGAQGAVCYGISSYDSNGMKSDNPHSGIYEATTSRTLDLNGGNPACNQGGIAVVEPVCYDARGNGNGTIAPTITGDHNNRITDYTALCMTTGSYMQVTEEVSPTLMARDYKDPNLVTYPSDVLYPVPDDVKQFIKENNADAPHQQDLLQDADGVSRTLACGTNAAGSHLTKTVIYTGEQYIVRRLTPTECARLQGFPDRWGDIPQKDTFTDEEYSFWLNVRNTHAAINGRSTKDYTKEQLLRWYNKLHSDSSEYKMWGNGIALPNALYVMQGIAEVISNG